MVSLPHGGALRALSGAILINCQKIGKRSIIPLRQGFSLAENITRTTGRKSTAPHDCEASKASMLVSVVSVI